MTSKREIDKAVADYRDVPRSELPAWCLLPVGSYEFDLAFAVSISRLYPDKFGTTLYPTYDADDQLLGWHGIGT